MASPDSAPRDERPRPAATASSDTNAADHDDEGTSGAMLDRATYGQTLDPENDGQQMADQMDDSMRSDMQASATGPAPASDENVPRQLTDPSDRAFTLPEEQV